MGKHNIYSTVTYIINSSPLRWSLLFQLSDNLTQRIGDPTEDHIYNQFLVRKELENG